SHGIATLQFMFEDCVIDPGRRELTLRSQVVPVGPQVFDLLLYLVRNHDRVVSKDDLLEAVWGGRIVSDSTITSHINAVRKAIRDSGGEQRLVRTVARKGFRFVGTIKVAEIEEARPPDRLGGGEQELIEPKNKSPSELLLPNKPSITVLPFENLSG